MPTEHRSIIWTILTLKYSHYLFSASIGLEHSGMHKLHAVLDANGRPLKLLGVVRLRLRLCNAYLCVLFIVAPTLDAALIIETSFLDSNVKAIRFMEGVVETYRGSIRIFGPNKATMSSEEV